jgi:TorA maturation chaperone TorD
LKRQTTKSAIVMSITALDAIDLAHDASIDAACESLYRFLSAALANPRSAKWRLLFDGNSQELAQWSAELLRRQFADCPLALARGELSLAHLNVAPILEHLSRPEGELLDENVRVFGMVTSRDCPPYETEFHAADDTFFRTQQMADVAGFYRAFGLELGVESPDRADHISLELEFVAFLLMKKRLARASATTDIAAAEQAATCHEARVAFLRDHLCWWTPSFAHLLARKAGAGFYAAAAELIAALLPVERYRLGIAPPAAPSQPAADDPSSIHECGACALGRL